MYRHLYLQYTGFYTCNNLDILQFDISKVNWLKTNSKYMLRWNYILYANPRLPSIHRLYQIKYYIQSQFPVYDFNAIQCRLLTFNYTFRWLFTKGLLHGWGSDNFIYLNIEFNDVRVIRNLSAAAKEFMKRTVYNRFNKGLIQI